MRAWLPIILLALGLLVGFGVGVSATDPASRAGRPPEAATIASASLAAAQKEARLTVFAARFSVAVTSSERQLGLSAEKTMIVPGLVRYDLDWNRLTPANLKWNANERVLLVEAPEIVPSPAAIDLQGIREYRSGGILMALTDAENRLDAANRIEIGRRMAAEAQNPTLTNLARESAREAVARTFALPLAAANVPARVVVRFPGESSRAY